MNNRKVINISHCNSYLHFLCWLKESLRQASKKELVHFFEREQTSPKVTEAKERALCGSGKKSFPSRRPAGGTTHSASLCIVLSPQPCYGRRIFSFTPHVAFSDLQPTGNTTDIFYYHTNHLGSTAFVTDNNAIITQGFLYAPFGEITTEYNANFGYNVLPKYSFNAKELDEETGMYYYEARYYKPPVFTSRDPMFEKYFWMTPYAYCANNPVKYVDPTGMKIWIVGEDGNEIEYIPGMQYEGESCFQKQVIEALNYGYENSATAEKMIGELCGPEFQYKISSGNESGYSPSRDCAVIYKEGADEAFYEKGGGVITWNPQGESFFEKDPKSGLSVLYCRPTMGLLHELGHAWDHMAGLLTVDKIKFEGLEVNEWTATRTENMIRKELKLPLRTYYEVGEWEGKNHPEGPRLLDSEDNHRYTQYQHQ